MKRKNTIGFDRRIDLEWLDAVAAQVAAGAKEEDVREHLWSQLAGQVAGEKINSARGKTVTVLCHVWSRVPAEARALRDRAAALFRWVAPRDRLAIHWAMVLGTYPFAADVARAAGGLLMLHGEVALAQIDRKLIATWGERSTVKRAAQRIVRSMAQWGTLAETLTPGIYRRPENRYRIGDEIAHLLAEALLIDSPGGELLLERLVVHPALFPFELQIDSHQLRKERQFRVHRQGLDMDVVQLSNL